MKATSPLEYVCFFPLEMTTKVDGEVYVFFAVDAFSYFSFFTGIEKNNSDESILKHIKLLTENKEFLMHRDKGFTLVLHAYENLADDINAIINPVGGKLMFNDPFVAIVFAPVLESLFKGMEDLLKAK